MECEVSELLGKTLITIDKLKNDDRLIFCCSDGTKYRMYAEESCSNDVDVYIDDIAGDLNMLIGHPLLMAEEAHNPELTAKDSYYDPSYTWTFYKFATILGYVTIRWYGRSNGCYSEEVYFERIEMSS